MDRTINTNRGIRMERTGDDNACLRIIISLLLLLSSMIINAQSLSTEALTALANSVKQHYAFTMAEGASVHKIHEGNVLVAVVSIKKSQNMHRVAQVKAARIAGEYLEGSMNKSVTVYETIEKDSYSLNDESKEINANQNSLASTTIDQNVSDKTERVTEENFSDKIIQSSLTRVNHMEPLTHFIGEEGSQLFAFYIILK